MSTGQGQGQEEAQVSTDDLAGLSPETIQNIVNTRLGGTLSAPSSAPASPSAGQEGASTGSEAASSPASPASPSSASQAPELRQPDEFTAQGELDGDDEEELDGDDDGDGDGEDDSEPFTPPNLSDEEEYVQLGEQRIPRRVVEAYQRFDEAFQSDPGLRALVSAYLQSGTVPAQLVQPSPQQPQSAQQQPSQQFQPPVDLDLDDPATRTLWEAHVATQRRLDAITAHLQTQQQQTQAEQMGRSQALVNRAVKSFQTQHNLTDEETQRLCGMVQRSNLIESFMRTPDPINGTPQRPDPLRAVEQSLDVMFHYAPEFRNRTVAVAEQQRRETSRKKAKLSSLSPRSGGSQSRKTPAPTDEAGRRAAMVAEVGEMMAGTWSG